MEKLPVKSRHICYFVEDLHNDHLALVEVLENEYAREDVKDMVVLQRLTEKHLVKKVRMSQPEAAPLQLLLWAQQNIELIPQKEKTN